ncbi:MAG: diphosphomevalonate decarboxylase [Chloroflexota bacterium]|nr:diphosphomevalonate decarboxylase [Chloroflexota bacterium]
MNKATAVACSNIAFVKYWGKRDEALRLPLNSSLSMALSRATTTTTVAFDPNLAEDEISIDGQVAPGPAQLRVIRHLDRIRRMARLKQRARVASRNSFPRDAGLASSASGFSALTLAATSAAGLKLSAEELSRLARLGSGSAARSIPSGFDEWHAGRDHESSFAEQIAPPQHWPELRDIVAVLERAPKTVGSTEGMALARTSPHLAKRLALVPERLERARQAILDRDLAALGEVSEEEAVELHLIAMSSHPPIFYWQPATLALIHRVLAWRSEGLKVYFTIDAGPNVHLLCEKKDAKPIIAALEEMVEVKQIIVNMPGPAAHLCSEHLF